jgi:hypothetical protein
LNAKEAFKTYHILKLHFKSNYDIFKYNNEKFKFPEEFFLNHQSYFIEASKISDWKNFCLANFFINPQIFIRELIDSSEAKDIYVEWKKRNLRLEHFFKNDLDTLGKNFKKTWIEGPEPEAYTLLKKSKICPETVLIFDQQLCIIEKWKGILKDDYYFKEMLYLRYKKYSPFLKNKSDKFKKLIIANYK